MDVCVDGSTKKHTVRILLLLLIRTPPLAPAPPLPSKRSDMLSLKVLMKWGYSEVKFIECSGSFNIFFKSDNELFSFVVPQVSDAQGFYARTVLFSSVLAVIATSTSSLLFAWQFFLEELHCTQKGWYLGPQIMNLVSGLQPFQVQVTGWSSNMRGVMAGEVCVDRQRL